MYEIYNTEGIILSCGDIGEANKIITIFTEKFGLISAAAQSVRNIKSKLRCSLQKFSVVSFSLVKGRDIWRITNTEHQKNLFSSFSPEKEKREIVLNILFLIKKLLAGETENPELYKIIKKAFIFLEKNNFKKEELKVFESILVIRILGNLGYFNEKLVSKEKTKSIYRRILLNSSWNFEILDKMKKNNKESIKEINNSLMNTGLF